MLSIDMIAMQGLLAHELHCMKQYRRSNNVHVSGTSMLVNVTPPTYSKGLGLRARKSGTSKVMLTIQWAVNYTTTLNLTNTCGHGGLKCPRTQE